MMEVMAGVELWLVFGVGIGVVIGARHQKRGDYHWTLPLFIMAYILACEALWEVARVYFF